MKKQSIIIVCIILVLTLVACNNDDSMLGDPWDSQTTDAQIEQYNNQIEEIANRIENSDIANVITDVLKAKDIKRITAQIVNNEEGHSSRVLDNIPELDLLVKPKIGDSEIFRYIPNQDLFGKEFFINYGILFYMPIGRRYMIYEYVFVEEQTVRKVVLIAEVEDDDSIKMPYHLYAMDIRVESVYRGEGAPRTVSYEVENYEYGRLPDLSEEQ